MHFLSAVDNNTWPERLRRFRHTCGKVSAKPGSEGDRETLLEEIEKRRPVIVVTDGPRFDEEYMAMVAARVPLLITLDERTDLSYPSDLVINPMLGRKTDEFRLYPGSQVVNGARFAMIRAEFRRARAMRAMEPGGPLRALVALGAGDVVDDSVAVVKSLLKSRKVEKIDLCLGPTPRSSAKISSLLSEAGDRVSAVYDARDLGIRMTKSHLLVTGAGNTALEAACVGMPMLMIERGPQQRLNASWLEELGVAWPVGTAGKVDQDKVRDLADMVLEDSFERKTMSRAGRKLIDGRGPDRIVTAAEVLLRRSRGRKQALAA
jgi:spore coat polysaccharide biosynthesis predicted glycosyltransferase SpsG